MRRYVPLLPVATIIAGVAFAVVWHAKFTIAAEERKDEFSGVSYGYRIQQTYFWNDASLTIWLKRGRYHQMDASFSMPRVTIQRIDERRWLSNGAAIYLQLTIQNHDSMSSVGFLRVIFDFHTGQIYTSSQFALWRFWNEKNGYQSWTSETEFNNVLRRYSDGEAK